MKFYRSELHLHTVLSPCAEVEMIPPLIIDTALEMGIDIIAITDHNSSANVRAVQQAAENTPLTVLPGMEVQTREDVHSLCLFDTMQQLEKFQSYVDQSLPQIKNQPDHFGEQFIVDATGEYIRTEERLLITSCSLSLNQAYALVTELKGLFIPAHINRKTNGLIENLGFIPPDLSFPAVEISRHITPEQAKISIPSIGNTPVIQNGDAHRLDEILGNSSFFMQSPSISEILLALQGHNGRSYEVRIH